MTEPAELSVGVSPLEDRVTLCVGAERVSLTAQQAISFAQLIADASQQVINAGKREQPLQ